MALLNSIYPDWGERALSDIDILVNKQDLNKLSELLLSSGATLLNEKNWRANAHKKVFHIHSELAAITLEVHTQLFINEPTNFIWKQNNSGELETHQQLVHLMGHLAHQHNFLKLFWLMDIHKFIEKNSDSISWPQLYELAEKLRLVNSVHACLYAIELIYGKNFHPQRRPLLLRLFLNKSFLLNPRQHAIRYFALKHFIKDQISEAFRYDFLWLVNKFKK